MKAEDLTDLNFWESDATDWNTVLLGPFELPGLCEVEVETSRKLDVQSPPGADGANITDKGYQGAKVKIKITVWLEEHRIALLDILPCINPRRLSKEKKGWDIDHPATAFHDVKAVYVEKIKGPNVGRVPGTKEIELECIEWFPQKKVNAVASKTKVVAKSSPPTAEERRAPDIPKLAA